MCSEENPVKCRSFLLVNTINELRMAGIRASDIALGSFVVTKKAEEIQKFLNSYEVFLLKNRLIDRAGVIGGGQNSKPGGLSLAHNGVPFFDKFHEFRKNVLEVLRQPIEDGHVTVSRATSSVTYPVNFTLLADMNPCGCFYR